RPDHAPGAGKAAVIQRGKESHAVRAQGDVQREEIMAKLTKPARDRISATKFAFPKQRKEPLENASHVRNAAARFNQVTGVTEAERRAAWKRIQSAAKRYGVELEKSD
ncbi:MAG TPA: DUF6582 domain-containing protein, partial [Terriglobales bacterium]